jgi:hypothetical protein
MFYDAFEPYVDRITVCDFSLLISDFGRVVTTLNERHGTSFSAEVTDAMKQSRKPRGDEDREKKQREKERLRDELKSSASQEAIKRAVATYEVFLARPEVLRAES